jgi:hypothetical protein
VCTDGCKIKSKKRLMGATYCMRVCAYHDARIYHRCMCSAAAHMRTICTYDARLPRQPALAHTIYVYIHAMQLFGFACWCVRGPCAEGIKTESELQ